MKSIKTTVFISLLAGIACAPPLTHPSTCAAQETTPTQQAVLSKYNDLRKRVADSELAAEEKKPILDLLTQAESQSKETISQQEAAAASQGQLASLERRVAEARADLKALQDFQPQPAPEQSLPELEALLLKLDSELATAKQAVTEAESVAARAPQRRREIETAIPKLTSELDQRRSQIDAANTDPELSLGLEAKRFELSAAEQLLLATSDALKNEAALIDAHTTASYYQLNRDLETRRQETAQQQRDVIHDAVEFKRAIDAAERVESAEAQLATLHLALKPIGQQNQELAELNQEIAGKVKRAEATLEQRNTRLEELRSGFKETKSRVITIGLTEAVGSMLRNLKESLPRATAYRLRAKERQSLINEAHYLLIDLKDRRNASLDVAVSALLSKAQPPIPYDQRSELAKEAKSLLTMQRTEFLDPAISSQTKYFNNLVSLSANEQQIVQLVQEATDYVNERVLWILSTKPLTSQLTPSAEERWFLLPTIWGNVSEKAIEDLSARPILWGAALLALLGLVRFRRRLRLEIQEIGQQVTKSTHTTFAPTAQSLLLTIATAAPLALIFGFLAWRLGGVAGNDQALLAIVAAARTLALLYFPIELLRQVCRSDGLGVSHFGWPANSCRRLRGWLRSLLLAFVPLMVIASFLQGGSTGFGQDTLERYVFIAAMGLLAFFVARILHPRTGLPSNYLRLHAGGWANHLSYAWYPLLVVGPIALIVLAVFGYYFTSQQLAWRVFVTLCLLLAIILTGAIVSRWMLLHRRRLLMEQVRRERAAVPQTVVSEVPIEPQEPTAEELRLQMQQTRRLVKTVMLGSALVGVWFIWSDVITSGRFSEDWWVWESTTTITETVTSETGEPVTRTRDVIEKITVADIILALAVLIVTFLATRNIPGLLEFALLRRLPLDNSIRYAITSLASYAIALVGLVVAGNMVGIHWNQIQWMATALTFGLAFGLQEVFANFVAGIIILFEQPVRVGDVVEIDGVTGVVSRIRIRATTITDWNRKDYIVPNKEFITGKVLNWTRSDDINRAVINIGVAYGSDTDRVRELLLQVAQDHPDVLADPGPLATFEGFGDNALNFVLRAFIGDLSKRLSTIHDLHTNINKVFEQVGIEISFPQRDLHLRSVADPILQHFAPNPAEQKTAPGSQRRETSDES